MNEFERPKNRHNYWEEKKNKLKIIMTGKKLCSVSCWKKKKKNVRYPLCTVYGEHDHYDAFCGWGIVHSVCTSPSSSGRKVSPLCLAKRPIRWETLNNIVIIVVDTDTGCTTRQTRETAIVGTDLLASSSATARVE